MSRYIIITPVRNEADHIGRTIESMVAQTERPSFWVIVNDGSTDATGTIIDEAAKQHPWIRTLHRADRGFRKSGGGVIEAFKDGLRLLSSLKSSPGQIEAAPVEPPTVPWDFLVKLDGDLFFEPDYFAQCLGRFEKDAKLGIGGGVVCGDVNGDWVEEVKGDPPFHVRGATKIYRRACWDAIGGLLSAPGWDTLDEVKANMLGWRTYTFRDIRLLQLKSTGTADGTWKNWVKNGRANYITGYHPLFMIAKCASRLRDKPYGVISAALFYGFFTSYFRSVSRVDDPQLIDYLRDQQLRRLTLRPSLWSANGK